VIDSPTSSARRPRLVAPPGACDCHMHIYGPADRFPYGAETTVRPPEAPLEDYLSLRDRLGLQRTVFVQPSAYATDNACLIDAIKRCAPAARGIPGIEPDIAEDELAELDAAGMRGVRFHQIVAGCLRLDVLEPIADRIKPFGWHVQVQLGGDDLVELEPRLAALPVDFVIDHMGRIPIEGGTDRPAFKTLLRLLETGRCWVKLSAPYHVSQSGPPTYDDCAARARELVRAAPDRMIWGSNWPHPSVREKPDDVDLLDVLLDWAVDDDVRHKILVDNPARLFGF
jgi:D-galactarolactone isomerase